MKHSFKSGLRGIAALALALGMAGLASAAITTNAMTVRPVRGLPTQFGLNLQTTDAVAAVQGQINYNPAILSNPRVSAAEGAPGFIALGNQIQPGKYNFVVYANPTQSMLTWVTEVWFVFDTATVIPPGTVSVVTYELEAASTPAGVSITPVDYAPVTLAVGGNASEGDWMLYE